MANFTYIRNKSGLGKKKPDAAASGLAGVLFGGDEEDRTPDLRIANATLSQLSYVPSANDYIEAKNEGQAAAEGVNRSVGQEKPPCFADFCRLRQKIARAERSFAAVFCENSPGRCSFLQKSSKKIHCQFNGLSCFSHFSAKKCAAGC